MARRVVAFTPILVRYGEIGIKSKRVREQFERRLVNCIEEQLILRSVEAETTRTRGRIYVHAGDVDGALDALAHTFGVVSASPTIPTEGTLEAIAALVVERWRDRYPLGASFAVRVKRTGQQPFTSLDVAKACAERVLTDLADKQPRVNLTSPDVELRIEVRDGKAFLFDRTVQGPGGLPIASQGRTAVWVDSARSAHAAWLIAKRGSGLVFFAPDVAQAEKWLAPLRAWVPGLQVHEAPSSSRAAAWAALGGQFARHKCQAIVVGDRLDEVAGLRAADTSAGMPVFRPLVGYHGASWQALCTQTGIPEGEK